MAGLALAVLSIGVAGLRRKFWAVTVLGTSMIPALDDGDRVLVHRRRSVQSGQIVVARHRDAREWLIKRLVAGPGDPVPPAVRPRVGVAHVPANSYVLLGDNRACSRDSRTLGFFPSTDVLGQVVRSLPARRVRPNVRVGRPPVTSIPTGNLTRPARKGSR